MPRLKYRMRPGEICMMRGAGIDTQRAAESPAPPGASQASLARTVSSCRSTQPSNAAKLESCFFFVVDDPITVVMLNGEVRTGVLGAAG